MFIIILGSFEFWVLIIVEDLILFDCVNNFLASFDEKSAIILEFAPKICHFLFELFEFWLECSDLTHDSLYSLPCQFKVLL